MGGHSFIWHLNTYLPHKALCHFSTEVVSLGWPEENQRVILGLGGHVPFHQQQPALAAWRAQWLRFLCLLGGASGVRSEGQSMHCHCPRPHLWKSYRWETYTCIFICCNCLEKCWHDTEVTVRFDSFCFPSFPGNPNQSSRPSCKKPCSLHTTCTNCTSQAMECMWCGSAQRCVDSTAYVISFPYGQCLEWQTGDCVGKFLSRWGSFV